MKGRAGAEWTAHLTGRPGEGHQRAQTRGPHATAWAGGKNGGARALVSDLSRKLSFMSSFLHPDTEWASTAMTKVEAEDPSLWSVP